jgi:hypothetical protein
MLGHYVGALSEMKHACKIFIVKPEENRPHRSRWEDGLDSTDTKDLDWIHLVEDSIRFGAFVSMMLIH